MCTTFSVLPWWMPNVWDHLSKSSSTSRAIAKLRWSGAAVSPVHHLPGTPRPPISSSNSDRWPASWREICACVSPTATVRAEDPTATPSSPWRRFPRWPRGRVNGTSGMSGPSWTDGAAGPARFSAKSNRSPFCRASRGVANRGALGAAAILCATSGTPALCGASIRPAATATAIDRSDASSSAGSAAKPCSRGATAPLDWPRMPERGWSSRGLRVVHDDPLLWTAADAAGLLGPPRLEAAQVRRLIRMIGLKPIGKRRVTAQGSSGRHARVYRAGDLIAAYEALYLVKEHAETAGASGAVSDGLASLPVGGYAPPPSPGVGAPHPAGASIPPGCDHHAQGAAAPSSGGPSPDRPVWSA